MSYLIVDLEIREDIPNIILPAGAEGVALLVRRGTRPIGFLMQAVNGREYLPAQEVSELIARHCAGKLLQQAIREELMGSVPRKVFPSLSIAVCSKDRPQLLERLLSSLLMMARPESETAVEILVIDNAPSDESTRQLCHRFSEVRYVREPKVGLNFARNCAVSAASGAILAFLDDDVVVDRWWLLGLYEALQENPGASAVTGLVLPFELETPAQILFEVQGGFRRGFNKLRYHLRSMPDDPMYPCGAGTFGAGCNMAFRRDILLALGGFDEALDTGAPLPGGGDLDIFYRVIRSGGLLVYEPRALVFHQHRRELKNLRRQYWTWGLGFMAYVDKSYRADPDYRPQFRHMVGWWFRDKLRQLLLSLCGLHPLFCRLITAEFMGGIVGLMGTYTRSRRRTDQIRRQNS